MTHLHHVIRSNSREGYISSFALAFDRFKNEHQDDAPHFRIGGNNALVNYKKSVPSVLDIKQLELFHQKHFSDRFELALNILSILLRQSLLPMPCPK